jgi:hypothetical protein
MSRRRSLVLFALGALLFGGFAPAFAQDATPEPTLDRALDGGLGGTYEAWVAYHGEPDETDPDLVWLEQPTPLGPATVTISVVDGIVIEVGIAIPDRSLDEEVVGREVFAVVAPYAPLDSRCRLKGVETAFSPQTYLCTSTRIKESVPESIWAEFGLAGGVGSYSLQVDPLDDDIFDIAVTLGHDLEADVDAAPAPSGDGATITGNGAKGSLDGVFGGDRASWDAAFGAPIDVYLDEYGDEFVDYGDDRFDTLSVYFNPETGVAEYVIVTALTDGVVPATTLALGALTAFEGCTALALDEVEGLYLCESSDLANGLTQNDYDLAGSASGLGEFLVLTSQLDAGVYVVEISL